MMHKFTEKQLYIDDEHVKRVCTHRRSIGAAYSAAVQINDLMHFNVGDVLVAIDRDSGNPYTKGKLIIKFVVCKKEDCGFVWCKQINKSGKLGTGLIAPAEWDHRWKFIQDPEAIDATILGGDYDPFERAKILNKAERTVKNHNAKIKMEFNKINIGDQLNKLRDMKVFWTINRYQEKVIKCEFIGIVDNRVEYREIDTGDIHSEHVDYLERGWGMDIYIERPKLVKEILEELGEPIK